MIDFDKEFNSHKEFRDCLHNSIRKELHGPVKSDEDEYKNKILQKSPEQNYSLGILFPKTYNSDLDITSSGEIIEKETLNDILNIEEYTVNTKSTSHSNDTSPENFDDVNVKKGLYLLALFFLL